MLPRVLVLAALAGPVLACRPPEAAAPAIPPPADAAPVEWLELEPDDEEPEEVAAPPPAPAVSRCEPPPRAQIDRPDFGLARSRIGDLLRLTGAPSLAVAVSRDREILWEEGFGWADRRRRRRADEHTMYSLASISKPFTAAGIMLLRERGELELERPINEYLPEPGIRAGAGDVADATVERVANHTAGLPLHYQFYYGDRGKPPAPAETRRRYAVTITAPGERYQYSNLGFGLLEHVIAARSGRGYADFMRKELFEPLDLQHTFVGRPPRGSGREAVRYSNAGEPVPPYGFDHDGASALYSSAHDLVRFGMFLLGHHQPAGDELLSEASRRRMRQVLAPADDYGVGLGVRRYEGMASIRHTGGMPGVRTLMIGFPEQGVVIVVLTNSSRVGRSYWIIVGAIADALGLPSRSDDICRLPPGDPLLGRWQGQVETIEGPRALALEIQTSGEVTARVGEDDPVTVRDVGLREGRLRGGFYGDVAAELAEDGATPPWLRLDLALGDGTLRGGLSASIPDVATTTLYVELSRAP